MTIPNDDSDGNRAYHGREVASVQKNSKEQIKVHLANLALIPE